MNRIASTLLLAGMASAPALAASLATTDPAESLPAEALASAAPMAIESWTSGSATLVPLMAADMQSTRMSAVDAPADAASGAVGKPIDDVAFVKQATESGRKEIAAARDALPQLKNPEL